jgi:GNAT superfamily N-acetyltransferase
VRTAVEADIPALASVIELAMRTTVARAYRAQQVESALQYLVGVDRQLIEDGTYYVAEANRTIVGCGGWSRRNALYGGENIARPAGAEQFLDPARDAAKMRVFFVHPGWTRRGIGRAILQMSERAAIAAGFTTFELLAMFTGVPMYAACGYRIVDSVFYTMPDGVPFPGVRMAKGGGVP